MTIPIKISAIMLLISSIMSSCVVYHPQTTDISLISKKNDLRVDGGISIVPSIHGTISYGLTKKIAVQGFGSAGSEGEYYFQAATGLYKNKGNNRVMELYGGFGNGYGKASANDAQPGHLYGDYQLYFVQLNYGKIASTTSNFEIGFGVKTGYLHSNMTNQNYYDSISGISPFDMYHDKSILFEPAGFIRMGGEHFKFSIKLANTLIYKFTNTDRSLPYAYINLGLGLNYRL